MGVFREQNAGHLVVVSSFAALRGLPKQVTAYASSKAGALALAEGIRADVVRTPIEVTTLLPGYIESEMTGSKEGGTPLLAGTERGVREMVKAIERETAKAYVPRWPWLPLSLVMRLLPAGLLRRFS